MENHLISWIGNRDKNKHENEDIQDKGPLFSCINNYQEAKFSTIYLLYTCDKTQEQADAEQIKSLLEKKYTVILCPVKKINPARIEEVTEQMTIQLKKYKSRLNKANVYYNLASGTPAMYAVSLLFSTRKQFGKTSTALLAIGKDFIKKDLLQVTPVTFPDSLAYLQADFTEENDRTFIASCNKKIYEQVNKIAHTSATVLILGETGVGKTHLAQYIHDKSDRNSKKMISINCAQYLDSADIMRSELFGHRKGSFTGANEEKEGAFKLADKSTLFLDEIGELPLSLQGMLLHAVEDGKFQKFGGGPEQFSDVRIITATNRNLKECVQKGTFREDLYYRLAQYNPTLKSIKNYTEKELSKLLDTFLGETNAKWFKTQQPRKFDKEAREAMINADWKGNIREFKFRLESICLLSDSVVTKFDVLAQLDESIYSPSPTKVKSEEVFLSRNLKKDTEEYERKLIIDALSHNKYNVMQTASFLGVALSTLRSKIKNLNIKIAK